MHTVEDMLVEKNYSKCPLKKRPVNYQFEVADESLKKLCATEQPENLSLKKKNADVCSNDTTIATSMSVTKQEDTTLINVGDCCEDEGVDVDHTDDDVDDEELMDDDDDDDDVDIEVHHSDDATNTTQAAALAAAAAVAAVSASVVVPTPTYPKCGLQTWNFPMSPYTAEFYRTINTPHLATQISPLRGDLLSPSSPSDSIGSSSPPPHYLHGRASSVSPPMRSEIIHRPIGVRQLPTTPQQHQLRFMPYPLTAYHHTHTHAAAHHHQHHATTHLHHPVAPYPLGYTHHAPISPAYSDSSYYSMRSVTPESNCSSLPEDLSLKHTTLQRSSTLTANTKDFLEKKDAEAAVASPTSAITAVSSTSSTNSITTTTSKKDKTAPPRYQCPDCQKSYSTFSGLTKHQQFHCPAAEGNQVKKSFSCKDCDKTYVSLGALKMHIRTHTLPCKCNICGKAFSRPWLLQGHIRTHTGEKPFSCQHCHRAFADRSNLRAHLQTHSDIKKYSCSNCSKTFSRMSLLTKHSEGGCSGAASAAVSGISSSCHSSSSSSITSNSNGNISGELSSYAVYAEH